MSNNYILKLELECLTVQQLRRLSIDNGFGLMYLSELKKAEIVKALMESMERRGDEAKWEDRLERERQERFHSTETVARRSR